MSGPGGGPRGVLEGILDAELQETLPVFHFNLFLLVEPKLGQIMPKVAARCLIRLLHLFQRNCQELLYWNPSKTWFLLRIGGTCRTPSMGCQQPCVRGHVDILVLSFRRCTSRGCRVFMLFGLGDSSRHGELLPGSSARGFSRRASFIAGGSWAFPRRSCPRLLALRFDDPGRILM